MPSFTPYSEQELLARIARGDEAAFAEFFYQHAPGVFVIIRKLVKEEEVTKDILQEVFIKAWMHRADFRQMEKPASWLMRTGSNMALNYLRNERTRAGIRQEIGALQPASAAGVDERVHTKEVQSAILEAVGLLPAQRRKIYQLSRDQGMDRAEIALALGISENTVKNQLVIALKAIRDHLSVKGISLFATLAAGEFLFLEATLRYGQPPVL